MVKPLAACGLTLLISFLTSADYCIAAQQQSSLPTLKELSLEQLMDVEITSVSKKEQKVGDTAAAIYVITQEEIDRSGVTSIPEALRLAPGVTVSRINSHSWAIGVRGFGTGLSRSVLVLIVGVLGKDPFGGALDKIIEGEIFHNRKIVARRFPRMDEVAANSHVLFIGASEENNLLSILKAPRRASGPDRQRNSQFRPTRWRHRSQERKQQDRIRN